LGREFYDFGREKFTALTIAHRDLKVKITAWVGVWVGKYGNTVGLISVFDPGPFVL